MECKKPQNLERCTCTSTTCERRGVCCECLAAHLPNQQLPRCCFPDETDKLGKRTFADFANAWEL